MSMAAIDIIVLLEPNIAENVRLFLSSIDVTSQDIYNVQGRTRHLTQRAVLI